MGHRTTTRTDKNVAPHTQKRAARMLWLNVIRRAMQDAECEGMGGLSDGQKNEAHEDVIDWLENPHRSGLNLQRVAGSAGVSPLAVKREGMRRAREATPPEEKLSREERVQMRIEKTLQFAIEHEEETGEFPMDREIGKVLDLSHASANKYVCRLRDRGYVEGNGYDRRLTEKAFATTH